HRGYAPPNRARVRAAARHAARRSGTPGPPDPAPREVRREEPPGAPPAPRSARASTPAAPAAKSPAPAGSPKAAGGPESAGGAGAGTWEGRRSGLPGRGAVADPVAIVQRDDRRLQRSQQGEGATEDKAAAEKRMNPERRRHPGIQQQHEGNHQGGQQEDHEDCRPVAAFRLLQIKAAVIAPLRQGKKTLEEPPLATARAAAGERLRQGRKVVSFHAAAPRACPSSHGGPSTAPTLTWQLRQARPNLHHGTSGGRVKALARCLRPPAPIRTSRSRRRGRARPRRRSASTRLPSRSRHGGSA